MIKRKDLVRVLPKYLEDNKPFEDYVSTAVHYYDIGTPVGNVDVELTPHITLREPGFRVQHYAILLGRDLKNFLVYKYDLGANSLIDMPVLVPVRDVFSQKKLLTLKLIRQIPENKEKSVAVDQSKAKESTTTTTTKKPSNTKAKVTKTTRKPRAKATKTTKVSK